MMTLWSTLPSRNRSHERVHRMTVDVESTQADKRPLQTLVVLVENKTGVLARVVDLFARRGFNIVSLAVAPTADSSMSRITIVVDVDSVPLDQIVNQLFKLINVVEIAQLAPAEAVERELLIATVQVDPLDRSQVVELVNIFRGKVVAVDAEHMAVSVEGSPTTLDDVEALLSGYKIIDLQRSGVVALPRIGSTVRRLRAV